MTMQNGILVRVPGMSKSELSDILGGISYSDERFKVAEDIPGVGLAADPATVALITTVATVLATEIVKAVVAEFLTWLKSFRKKTENPTKVHVTVALTLGGNQTAIVSDADQIAGAFPTLPSEMQEIEYISMRQES